MSTESNIPDFRSDNGLYKKKYPYPAEIMLSHSFYLSHPKEFFDFYFNQMIYPNAKPNKAHYALSKLEEMGKLKGIVTQNIDGLHQMAGSKKVYELHGSVLRNTCTHCQTKYSLEDMMKLRDDEGIPRCGESFTPDEGDTVLGTVSLGNGYTVYASGPVYPYVIPQTINGRTQDPVSTYPMDTAIELVELTTGNRYTYSQIKNDLVDKDGKADAATKLETDYLAQILLPSIKAQD